MRYASWTFPIDVTPTLFEVFLSDDGKYYWDITDYYGSKEEDFDPCGPFDSFQLARADMQDFYKAKYKFD